MARLEREAYYGAESSGEESSSGEMTAPESSTAPVHRGQQDEANWQPPSRRWRDDFANPNEESVNSTNEDVARGMSQSQLKENNQEENNENEIDEEEIHQGPGPVVGLDVANAGLDFANAGLAETSSGSFDEAQQPSAEPSRPALVVAIRRRKPVMKSIEIPDIDQEAGANNARAQVRTASHINSDMMLTMHN